MKKMGILLLVCSLILTGAVPLAVAAPAGLKEGAASLLIPGWGQYMNGEFDTEGGRWKAGAMGVLEIAAIITTAVVGGVVGYPQIWVGIGLFIGNHVWSAFDAFLNAKSEPGVKLGTASPVEKTEAVR